MALGGGVSEGNALKEGAMESCWPFPPSGDTEKVLFSPWKPALTRHLVLWSWTWHLLVPQGKSVIYKITSVGCFVIATWICWYGMWANKLTGSGIRMLYYYLEWKKKGTLFCLPHMPITFMLKSFWLQSWGDGSVGQWACHASMRAWWGFEFEPLTPVTVYACNTSTWPVWLAEKETSNSETLSENTILLWPEDAQGMVTCTPTPTRYTTSTCVLTYTQFFVGFLLCRV